MEEFLPLDGPQAIHQFLRRGPQSSPPLLLDLLRFHLRIRNKRHGTGLAPALASAHRPSMGNDCPNPGKTPARQIPSRDRDAPVSVGMVVAHTENDETGPTLHYLGNHLQRSRSRTPQRGGSRKSGCWTEARWAILHFMAKGVPGAVVRARGG